MSDSFCNTSLPEFSGDIDTAETQLVADVVDKFQSLETGKQQYDLLGFYPDKLLGKRLYRRRVLNHFQSIVRLPRTNYLIISGGETEEKTGKRCSHLIVVHMASRRRQGVWTSNMIRGGFPDERDRVVKLIGVDPHLWHAGGLDLCGPVLAVPIESESQGRKRSDVVFFNVADPADIKRFKAKIPRQEKMAGAVALTRLANGRYLAIVHSGRILDFYLTKGRQLRDGWYENEFASWSEHKFSSYQNLNLLQEPTGRLYVVGTRKKHADLFEVTGLSKLAALRGREAPRDVVPKLKPGPRKIFRCSSEYCDFQAGAGVYVDYRDNLCLYGVQYWVDPFRPQVDTTSPREVALVVELRGPLDHGNVTPTINDAWVELYEHTRFRGRRLTLVGAADPIEKYEELVVQGDEFVREVSSVKYQIPSGRTYQLVGRGGSRYDLPGKDIADEISSLKRAPLPGGGTVDFNDETISSWYKRV